MFEDAATRFSNKAEFYAKARPRYPVSIVHFLEEQKVLKPGDLIADIGCGTGLSAEPFLESGYSVVGVEPNAAMRAQGDAYLKHHDSFRSVEGTATETKLESQSVDLAIAAQAFHWFDLDQTRLEMRRILKSPGWFVAIWNHRNHTATPLHEGYEAILKKYCPEYHHLSDLYRSPERSAQFFVHGYQNVTLPNPQELDWKLFDARIQSSSYIPRYTDASYEPFMYEMRKLFETHAMDGKVHFDLEVWIHWGKVG